MEQRYVDRFMSRIVPSVDGCWEWNGAHTHGYAEGWTGETKEYAHRLSYERFVGPIPPGLVLDHLCRNRGCVRPDHLEAVTHRTNILRSPSMSAKWAKRTHCEKGHPFDEENTFYGSRGRGCRACWRLQADEVRGGPPSFRKRRVVPMIACEVCGQLTRDRVPGRTRFCSKDCLYKGRRTRWDVQRDRESESA